MDYSKSCRADVMSYIYSSYNISLKLSVQNAFGGLKRHLKKVYISVECHRENISAIIFNIRSTDMHFSAHEVYLYSNMLLCACAHACMLGLVSDPKNNVFFLLLGL